MESTDSVSEDTRKGWSAEIVDPITGAKFKQFLSEVANLMEQKGKVAVDALRETIPGLCDAALLTATITCTPGPDDTTLVRIDREVIEVPICNRGAI